MHTHGVCYGCNGLGIPASNDYLLYKKQVDSLVNELGKAEGIIQAMFSAMTVDQRAAVAAQLGASDISSDGLTRRQERRTALAAFGVYGQGEHHD